MAKIFGKETSRMEILRRVSDMRQLAGAMPFELVDGFERGTRGVRLYNAAGLDLNVVTDRGMGITNLSFGGTQLSVLMPVGSANPAYSERPGLGWLRTWPAGFLTVCGLTQVGGPALDGQEELGQHGRAAGTPASTVAWGGEWNGDQYCVWVEGSLYEGQVFGPNLVMRRRIWMNLDEACFWIEDTLTNNGFTPVPLMLLQHFNLGFPLLDSSARLETGPGTAQPRDEAAAGGLADRLTFGEPQAGYHEQVFYHDLQPDAQGLVTVRLVNDSFCDGKGIGVYWKYSKADYPVLVEWKMTGEGLYVLGVEPANCHVEGRVREREMGSLQMLQPFESRVLRIEIGFR